LQKCFPAEKKKKKGKRGNETDNYCGIKKRRRKKKSNRK